MSSFGFYWEWGWGEGSGAWAEERLAVSSPPAHMYEFPAFLKAFTAGANGVVGLKSFRQKQSWTFFLNYKKESGED